MNSRQRSIGIRFNRVVVLSKVASDLRKDARASWQSPLTFTAHVRLSTPVILGLFRRYFMAEAWSLHRRLEAVDKPAKVPAYDAQTGESGHEAPVGTR